jgi:hypothetical protein
MAGFANGFPVGLGERGEERFRECMGGVALLERGSEDGFYRPGWR